MRPGRLRALIAFKLKMAQAWKDDPEGMAERSRAGGRATAAKARRTKEKLADWLSTIGTWHTKDQLLQRIEKMDRTRKPHAWFRLMVSSGFIVYEPTEDRWRNLCQRI